MKKALLALAAIAMLLLAAWYSRLDLLFWAVPILREAFDPVPPNVPVRWQAGPMAAEALPTERPPNIVLILADDLGVNDVSFTGGGAADGTLTTPNIDALAREGVRFTNGYAANASCVPSRAALMTGRYATRFGVEFTPFFELGPRILRWMPTPEPHGLPIRFNRAALAAMPEADALGMPPEEITMAEVLQSAGYYTAHIGKWHLGGQAGMRPEHQGFHDSLYMAGTLYLPHDHPNAINARLPALIDRAGWAGGRYMAQFNSGPPFEPGGYTADYYTEEAVKVIENNRHRPFFLFLAQHLPHNPLQATRADYNQLGHIENHRLRVYAAMILALDRSVGRVLAALDANGLRQNTLVAFTSDNGGAGYIGLRDINQPFRGWKLTHFEGGLRVPLVARWPARIAPGAMFEQPVHHMDLFHTFAAAAGAEVPRDRILDGVDLVPFVRGEAEGAPHRTLYWRQGHHQSIQHDGWKLIRTAAPKRRWLFNLRADPTERTDLAAPMSDKANELETLLDAWHAEQAEPLWPSVAETPILVDKTNDMEYVPGDEYIYWPN